MITHTTVARALSGWGLELELTRRCQLECTHCYAESGLAGDHGTMTVHDWGAVISDAAREGVSHVQLIGGEPTMHPEFGRLLRHAVGCGLSVEVFSNLVHVRAEWWELFTSPKVSLATSYYSDQASEHGRVTGRRGSHARTRANIAEAVRRGIPIRAGIIDVLDGQRVERARAELEVLGVAEIGLDRLRRVGRGARMSPDVSQLCGGCGRGQAAISSSGEVWPCVLSRWMRAGGVKEQPLVEILSGRAWKDLVASIRAPRSGSQCNPDKEDCLPKKDGNDCHPSERPACNPRFCGPEFTPKNPPKDPNGK